jgi:hypothetical protein
VILCDFFPLYNFQCTLSTEEHGKNNILRKNIENRSISNVTQNNLTINEDFSSKFGLQQHNQPTKSEIILIVWMFTLFCEEIRQVKSSFSFFLMKYLFD